MLSIASNKRASRQIVAVMWLAFFDGVTGNVFGTRFILLARDAPCGLQQGRIFQRVSLENQPISPQLQHFRAGSIGAAVIGNTSRWFRLARRPTKHNPQSTTISNCWPPTPRNTAADSFCREPAANREYARCWQGTRLATSPPTDSNSACAPATAESHR